MNYAHSYAIVAVVHLEPKGPVTLSDEQRHLVDAIDFFVHAVAFFC
jgi:proteasome lid subunit RPN8/RPN11